MSWVIAHAISAVKSETPQIELLHSSITSSLLSVNTIASPRLPTRRAA